MLGEIAELLRHQQQQLKNLMGYQNGEFWLVWPAIVPS